MESILYKIICIIWVGAYEQVEVCGFWILGVKWGNVRKLWACGDYKNGEMEGLLEIYGRVSSREYWKKKEGGGVAIS